MSFTLKNGQKKPDIVVSGRKIKTVTLRSWIRNGKEGLPAQKIGKQWKFKISELDEWVKSGKSAD